MKRIVIALGLVFVVAIFLGAEKPPERKILRESTEWCNVWIPDSTSTDLPRVLLIGDSISMGYYPDVEKLLKGKAYCARLSTSKAVGDPALPMEIATVLSESKFDVIHFNIGMHGWAYSEDEYQKYLPELLDEIRKDSPNAKLVWASTTPVRKDRPGNATNARIVARNDIAKAFFTSHGIPIDDLNAVMASHVELHSDDVHFNAKGYEMLAKQVAEQIAGQLPPGVK